MYRSCTNARFDFLAKEAYDFGYPTKIRVNGKVIENFTNKDKYPDTNDASIIWYFIGYECPYCESWVDYNDTIYFDECPYCGDPVIYDEDEWVKAD